MILKKYKNLIYKTLEDLEFDHKDFEWEDLEYQGITDKHVAFKLNLKDSGLYFIICQAKNSFDKFFIARSEFKPGYPENDNGKYMEYLDIDDVISRFKAWIQNDVNKYIAELDTPNLWESYERSIQPLNFERIDFNDKSKFKLEEREHIKLGLNEIKLLIADNFDFSKNQLKMINQRLNYLEGATKRLNKTDWKSITISTVFGLILNLSVDTQTGQAILDLFKKVFENLPQLPF